MAKFTTKEKAEQYQKLALRTQDGERSRVAYAQSLSVPILREVSTQSSIMNIFTPVELAPAERAEFRI